MKTSPALMVLLAAAGAVLIWSAIYGTKISSVARDLLAGRRA